MVAVQVKTATESELFLRLLPRATQRAFRLCQTLPWLARSRWYLAGGTALALQVGHRVSVDLDFFTEQKKFKELDLEGKLTATGAWQTTLQSSGTLYGVLAGGKISFIAYPFFHPAQTKLRCGNIVMLTPPDIAAMKIIAISQRGRKRDFLDLYWYCTRQESLFKVIQRAVRQYPGQEKNMHHILKSLVYFADAEKDPLPKLYFKARWIEIKKFFTKEIAKLLREF